MGHTAHNKSVEFFETQFRQQVRRQDYALNPFEARALDYLTGTVLDLGSGLGNLSLEAGRRGHQVMAVDASPAAVERINTDAQRRALSVKAVQTDLEEWPIHERYDTIVAIGLLMFFRCERAYELLRLIQEHVNPGGRAVVNVLIEGTTFMAMFDEDNYCLLPRHELEKRFAGWKILSNQYETYAAPAETRKEFSTLVAEKPK